MKQIREIPHHRGGRGAKPGAGTLSSLDAKAEGGKGTGRRNRDTNRYTMSLVSERKPTAQCDRKAVSLYPSLVRVPKVAFHIPHNLGHLPGSWFSLT